MSFIQSINQFINVNVWDGVAPIIQARGSCLKRMTIKILRQKKDQKGMKTNNNNISVNAQSYTHPNPTELTKN